jgi:hypothetical protein
MVELRVLNSDLKLNKQIDPGRKHNNAHQRARSLAQELSRSNAHQRARSLVQGISRNNAHQRARSLAQGISRSNAHLPAKVETQGHRPDKPEMEIAVITTIEIQM